MTEGTLGLEPVGSEGSGAPVGHLLKAKATRTSQPKQTVRPPQGSNVSIEVAETAGLEPCLAALRLLGQVRNSRLPSLPFVRLLCSPGFRLRNIEPLSRNLNGRNSPLGSLLPFG